MDYYYLNGSNQPQGPVQKEALLSYGVTAQTRVWREGMTTWLEAGTIDELADLFSPVVSGMPEPPAVGGNTIDVYDTEAPICHLSSSIWGFVFGTLAFGYGLFLTAPFSILGIIFNTLAYGNWRKGKLEASERMERLSKGFGRAAFISGLILCIVVWTIFIIAYIEAEREVALMRRSYYYY